MGMITRRTFMRRIAVGTGTVAMLYTGMEVEAAGAEIYKLRIFHTNDHHARIEPVTTGTPPVPLHGGVSRRRTLLEALRQDASATPQLTLDAGDVFQGTLYFNLYRGMADLEFYNALKYDAMAVGNHEFDVGQQPFVDFINRAQFPILSANISVDPTSPLAGKIQPWIIKWAGKQRIGIIGVTTPDTAVLSNPGAGISFTDPAEAVRQSVTAINRRGVKKILVLSHLGITADRDLAAQVDGFQAIIGGHSHTPMGPMLPVADPTRPYPEIITNPAGKPVVVVTDWEWGRWLGDLELGFDATSDLSRVIAGRPTEVAPSITPDQAFEDRITVLAAPIVQLRATPVGSSLVNLNGLRADVRSRETNLGNLIADSTLAKTRATGSQIAIVNGGGIRTSIPAGQVTLGQVLEVLPFGNTLVVMTVTGDQVRQALENGVSQVSIGAGRFPQVGGMRYSYSPLAPVGSRVSAIEIATGTGFAPIDLNASYRLVVNNFIATGGDGYSVLNLGTNRLDTGFLDSDTLAEYIAANSPVNPQVEGRITIL